MEVQKRGYAEEIAQAIQHKISRLGLEDGDRLPPHGTLAKELNVSVPSLREGLQRLVAFGLLKITHGSGTVVAKPKVSDYFQLLNSALLTSTARSEEYVETRIVIEQYVVSLAATRGTDFTLLHEILERMNAVARANDTDRFRSEYVAFFRRLGKIAGNPVLTEIQTIVNTLMFAYPEVEKAVAEKMLVITGQLADLLDAVQLGHRQLAETAIADHISSLSRPAQISIVCDTFSTGSIGGSFYVVGMELCRIIRKYAGITIESEPSQGGIENVTLTDEGKAILALTQSDVAHHAFSGTGPFYEPHRQIRAICAANNLDLWIVTADPSIHDLGDLRGKRIAMGTTGGESSLLSKAVLDAYGYDDGDYRPYYLSISNAVQGIKSGQIDVLFYLSDGPGSALSDLSAGMEVTLLPIDPGHRDKILTSHPYWNESTIGSSVLPCVEEEVPTIRIPTLLITHSDVPREIIERITEAIIEHVDEIGSETDGGFHFGETSDYGNLSVPLHGGALDFYRSKGYVID
ncbi:MAG: TAXI family TRAP transporter solute-binding subunit [Spirochaetales bacterium]|nr:TAXI family TRAP transporter solute-binding subunit [Spirochaetales bacterium]